MSFQNLAVAVFASLIVLVCFHFIFQHLFWAIKFCCWRAYDAIMLFVGQSHHVLLLSGRRPNCMWRWRRLFWQLECLVVLLRNSRLVGLAHHRHRHSHCWRKFLISYDSNFVSKIERFKQIWIFFFNEYQFVFCRQIIIAIVWAIIACNKASRAEAGSVYVQPAQPQPQPGVTYVTTTVRFKLIFLSWDLSMHSFTSFWIVWSWIFIQKCSQADGVVVQQQPAQVVTTTQTVVPEGTANSATPLQS